jgi:hypothetical protein
LVIVTPEPGASSAFWIACGSKVGVTPRRGVPVSSVPSFWSPVPAGPSAPLPARSRTADGRSSTSYELLPKSPPGALNVYVTSARIALSTLTATSGATAPALNAGPSMTMSSAPIVDVSMPLASFTEPSS